MGCHHYANNALIGGRRELHFSISAEELQKKGICILLFKCKCGGFMACGCETNCYKWIIK